MNGQDLFDYLQGEWEITRKIINKLSPNLNASALGQATLIKKSENTISYKESLIVSWKNGLTTKAYKKYEYLLDKNTGSFSLCEIDNNQSKIMFHLSFDKNSPNLIKGEYQCLQDFYRASYEIINKNQFTLLFEVNGPNKTHSIKSKFIRYY